MELVGPFDIPGRSDRPGTSRSRTDCRGSEPFRRLPLSRFGPPDALDPRGQEPGEQAPVLQRLKARHSLATEARAFAPAIAELMERAAVYRIPATGLSEDGRSGTGPGRGHPTGGASNAQSMNASRRASETAAFTMVNAAGGCAGPRLRRGPS